MRTAVSVLVAATLLPLGLLAWKVSVVSKENDMKLTIYLKDPILTDGGTIIVMPRSVPRPGHDIETANVEVSAILSFVYFDYVSNDRWSLQFDVAPADIERSRSTRFKMLSIGSATYNDSKGEQVNIEQFNVFHVFGHRITEQESDSLGSSFTDSLQKDIACQEYGKHAKVCATETR